MPKTTKSKCGAGSPGKPGFGKDNTCGEGNAGITRTTSEPSLRGRVSKLRDKLKKLSPKSKMSSVKAWQRGIAKVAKAGLFLLEKGDQWENSIRRWVVNHIPSRWRTVGKRLAKVYFATYDAAKLSVYRVSRQQGLDAVQSYRLVKTVSAIDFGLGFVASHIGGVIGGPVGGATASFLPVASLAYLGWKGVKNPKVVIKASYFAVQETMSDLGYKPKKKVERHAADGVAPHKLNEEQITKIARVMKQNPGQDFGLHLSTAFDITHDFDKSVTIAKETSRRLAGTKYRYARTQSPDRYQMAIPTDPSSAPNPQARIGAGSFLSSQPERTSLMTSEMQDGKTTPSTSKGGTSASSITGKSSLSSLGTAKGFTSPQPSQYAHGKKRKIERNNGKEKKAGITLSRAVNEQPKPKAKKPAPPPTDQNAHTDDYDLDSLPEAGLLPLDLDDQSKFTKFGLIPVMDEHGLIIGRDQIKKPITVAHLKLMAQNSNALANDGEYAKILIGHTKDEAAESDQPMHVGFAKNFLLGKFRNKPCLLADLHIRKSLVPMALTYPHRSPELFRSKDHRDQNFVDAISLLRRAPERPLGLLTYGRIVPSGVERVRYARSFPALRPTDGAAYSPGRRHTPKGGSMALDSEDIKAIVTGVVHGVVAGMRGVLEEIDHKENESLENEGFEENELADLEGEEGEELADMEGEEGEAEMEEPEMEAEEEEDMERDQYASSAPSTTNVSIPKMGLRKGKKTSHAQPKVPDYAFTPKHFPSESKKSKYEAVPSGGGAATTIKKSKITGGGSGVGNPGVERMAKTQAGIEIQRYAKKAQNQQRTIEAQNKRIADLERYARAAERERDLASLAAQGYRFDIAQELEDCVDMSPAGYDKHLKRIMERYERDPIDTEPIEVAPDKHVPQPGEDINGLTADDSIKMARYARDNPQMSHTEAVNDWITKNMQNRRIGGRPA